MADDRMKNDQRDMNLGGAGQKNQGNYGQKTPGRGQQDDDEFSQGQRDTSQRSEPGHMKDDFGTSGQNVGEGRSNMGQGGQKGQKH
jgi:hypothetical protein